MKNIILISISIFFIISCNTRVSSQLVSGVEYRISKIDSVKDIYLIYAEKTNVSIPNTVLLKIASAKTKNKCRNNSLLINKIYKLNLESLYPKNFVSHHYLQGITFKNVFISFDKEYNVKKDLFITNDIEGMCYVKK